MTHVVTPQQVTIEYESIGNERDPAMLLIQGLGAQLVGWRREFCEALAAHGFRVIRFDNRDTGLSQKFPDSDYELADMADDATGLLDALGIQRAHIVGQSLGGGIAQEIAIKNPERVASLCLLYTAPNVTYLRDERDLGTSAAGPRTDSRDEAIQQYLEQEAWCASEAYPFDTDWIRELGGIMWDRCWCPGGVARQIQAVIRSGDHTTALRSVTARTLIVHGDRDRLIDVSAAEALAGALEHSTVRIFAGMGHELPAPIWPELVQEIAGNAARAAADGPA
jgi:pimeloyl-ACP methyl ester carboxylesterase